MCFLGPNTFPLDVLLYARALPLVKPPLSEDSLVRKSSELTVFLLLADLSGA
jgi:hypothetical protein